MWCSRRLVPNASTLQMLTALSGCDANEKLSARAASHQAAHRARSEARAATGPRGGRHTCAMGRRVFANSESGRVRGGGAGDRGATHKPVDLTAEIPKARR